VILIVSHLGGDDRVSCVPSGGAPVHTSAVPSMCAADAHDAPAPDG
jgi:hypothetical protein